MPNEKEKKLSQEEKRFANLAKRFIRQASIATKNFRMFGEKHPVLVNSLRNIHELLKTSLIGRASITYTFLEGASLVEDIPLKDVDPKIYSLILELKECGITSLTFQSGVTEDELKLLLKVLSSGPAFIKDEGGVINILKTKNAPHIRVDEMYFKRVSRKEEEQQEAKTQLADMLVVDYLMGKKAMPKDKMKDLAREISVNPQKMGNLLSDVSKKGIGTASGTVGFTCLNINRLANGIKAADGESADKLNKDISKLILALEPSLRSEVLRSDTRAGRDSDFIKGAVAEFSDEVITKIIVSDFTENKSSVVETRRLIRHILPEAARRTKIFPVLEKRLIQKGVSQKVCSRLLEGKFWADMTNDEKVKSVESHEPAYCIEVGVADEIKNLVFDLLSGKKFEAACAVIKKLLSNLASSDTDFKIRFVRDFTGTAILVFQSDGYRYKEDLVSKLGMGYKGADKQELEERFCDLFGALVKLCGQKKYYTYMPGLITAAGYDAVKKELLREAPLEEFLKNMLSDEKVNKNTAKALLRSIGKEAGRALCEVLISIEGDDFESYKKRHAISLLLKDSAGEIEDILVEKLSSDKPAVLKNALEALLEIGAQKSIEPVRKLAGDVDEKIQKRAQVALKKIEKRVGKLPS